MFLYKQFMDVKRKLRCPKIVTLKYLLFTNVWKPHLNDCFVYRPNLNL